MSLTRGHTHGNSPSALRNAVLGIHSEGWIRNELRCLDDWQRYRNSWAVIDHSSCVCRRCTILRGTKCSLIDAHVCQGHSHVLRIDSTKKVCKGTTAGSEAMSGGSSCLCTHRIRGSGGLGHRTYLEVQRRPSRIPTAAMTEIAVLSMGHPGVHSCLLSGTSTTTYMVLHVKNCSWLHF